MTIPSISRFASRVTGKLPLRTVLIVPFVLQIVGTVGLVGYLSYKNGYHEVSHLATQLQLEINSRIAQHLDSYLAVPSQLNKINIDAYELKLLNLFDFKSTGQYFWKQLHTFNISYINFATPKGEFIGAGDYGNGTIQIEEIPRNFSGKSYKYDTDNQGNRTRLVSVQTFDPHQESWYFNAVKTGKPVWSEIYNWDTNPEIMSIATSYPLYDKNKTLIGVTGIDLKLSDISRFLNKIKIGKSGQAFILERSGLLVASSVNEPSFTMVNGKAKRLNATKSRTPAIQLTTQYLQKHFGNLNKIQHPYQLNLDLSGQQQYVQVSPWRDQFGLDWLVVLVIPKADFTEQINANNNTTVLLCIAALLGSIGVGILTARWITKPILRLNAAAKDIAQGQWNQSIEIERSDEVGELSISFNAMAAQLQQSFTQLESLNEALGQSERKLRGIFNQTFQFIGMLSPDGILLETNQTSLDFAELQLEEVIGKPFWECHWWQHSLETQAQLKDAIARVCQGEFIRYEVDILGVENQIFKIDFSLKPIFDQGGKVEFIIPEGRDITARKQSEKILAEYNQLLETQVAERTAELAHVNEQLRHKIAEREQTEAALQASQARFAGILEIANDAIITVNAEQRITLFNQGAEKIFGYTADEVLGQPLRVLLPESVRSMHHQYVSTFTQSFAKARRMGERSEIFGRRKDGTEFPAEASISQLEINGEKFLTTILRDISARKLAEAALKAKTEELDRFFCAALDLLCIANTEGYFLRLNPQWEKTLGYRLEHLEGTKFLDYVHPEDLENTLDAIAQLADQQEIPHFVNRYRCRDGSYRWIEWRSVPVGNLIYASARDISTRKRAEEALRQSEATNRSILSTIPDLLIWMNQDGTYLEITVGKEFNLFSPEKSYVGTTIYNVLPYPIARQRMEYVQRALQTGELQIYEHQLMVEGETRYEETRIAASENGKVLVMVRDITARKRTEEILREREEQLQLALEGSGDGFWDWKVQTGEVYFSPRYLEMLGYEAEELPHNFSTWDRLIHPDDKPWVMQTLKAHLADSSVPYHFDYRMLTKGGEWKWIANYGKVVARDQNGTPLRMTGTHRDVSDRKRAALEL
ncbi:MAG TPA: PAS domain S-box protein, partial [Stenomitos sp.]